MSVIQNVLEGRGIVNVPHKNTMKGKNIDMMLAAAIFRHIESVLTP